MALIQVGCFSVGYSVRLVYKKKARARVTHIFKDPDLLCVVRLFDVEIDVFDSNSLSA